MRIWNAPLGSCLIVAMTISVILSRLDGNGVGSVGLSQDSSSAFRGEGSVSAGLDRLLERMAHDEFDLIAVGRAAERSQLGSEDPRAGSVANERCRHRFTGDARMTLPPCGLGACRSQLPPSPT